jgi:hypothetical protein
MTSALVSALLNHGFQLSFNDTYGDIVRQARPVRDTCTCTVGSDGAVELRMDGALMHSRQLDPMDPRDNTWLEAATAGHILASAVTTSDSQMPAWSSAQRHTLASWSPGPSPYS